MKKYKVINGKLLEFNERNVIGVIYHKFDVTHPVSLRLRVKKQLRAFNQKNLNENCEIRIGYVDDDFCQNKMTVEYKFYEKA